MAKKLTAQDVVGRLQGKGFSLAHLGRIIGRDSSLLSQVAKGKRPGANLVDPLRAILKAPKKYLSGKGVLPEEKKPERRKAKSGEPAKVRQPKPKLTPEEIDARARAEAEAAAKVAEAARRAELREAARGGITVTVSGRIGTSKDFRNRSVSADLEGDDAVEFLILREEGEQAALDFFFEVGYGAPLSVERLDSLTVS